MRLILSGSRSFGAAALQNIQDAGHDIAEVWSPWSPDDLDRTTDPLTKAALQLSSWIDPGGRTPEHVRHLEADLFVCAHSHDFISRKAREATRLGGIGYHPSLLPRHRGRDAVRWTIHMGDPIAGGSVYWLTDNVDGGPIAAQDWCHVHPRWDASELWKRRLFDMGQDLLIKTLEHLRNGVIVEIPQDWQLATWEPSWERPPLFRPDLTQIGDGVAGYVTHTTRETL